MNPLDHGKELVRNGEWQKALNVLLPLWKSQSGDPWTAIPLIKSLRKLDRPSEALNVAREAARYLLRSSDGEGHSAFLKEILYSLAAWCVWDLSFKRTTDLGTQVRACRTIRRTLDAGRVPLEQPKAPYVRAAISTAKGLILQGRSSDAFELLEPLNACLLDSTRSALPDGKAMPSDRERWLLCLSKACAETANWSRLLQVVDSGLADSSLAEQTMYFLKYRRGIALRNLGDRELALKVLTEVVAQKREWWAVLEMAITKWESGRQRKAIRDFCIAILDAGLSQLSARALLELSERLASLGRCSFGHQTRCFIESVWLSNGWTIKDELQNRLKSLSGEAPTSNMDLNSLSGKLRTALWETLDEYDPPLHGTIDRIMPSGKAMFIAVETKNDVYADVPPRTTPRPGDRVTFRMFPAFDRKWKRYTEAAIHVRLLR